MTVQELIVQVAGEIGVDPNLALAVAQRESGFNQDARGAAGEIGVFQLMPATAAAIGVDPTDLDQNIRGGIRYLQDQIERFGDVAQAVAAYNAGPGKVLAAIASGDWWSNIPSSTRAYVQAITGFGGAGAGDGTLPVFRDTVFAVAPGNNWLLWALAFFGLVLLLDNE